MSAQNQKLMYSISDAADVLSVSRGTIYREIDAGRLRFIQYRKRKFISRQAIDEWIQTRELETQGSRLNSVGIRQFQTEVNRECA